MVDCVSAFAQEVSRRLSVVVLQAQMTPVSFSFLLQSASFREEAAIETPDVDRILGGVKMPTEGTQDKEWEGRGRFRKSGCSPLPPGHCCGHKCFLARLKDALLKELYKRVQLIKSGKRTRRAQEELLLIRIIKDGHTDLVPPLIRRQGTLRKIDIKMNTSKRTNNQFTNSNRLCVCVVLSCDLGGKNTHKQLRRRRNTPPER